MQCGVVADGAAVDVGGVAVVDAHVGLGVLVVDDAQEEELAAVEEHAVGGRTVSRRQHALAIAVPRDRGRGIPLRLAVELGRLVLGHVVVRGVFHDARVGQVTCMIRDGHVIQLENSRCKIYFVIITHLF